MSVSEDGQTITASAGDETAFTVRLTESNGRGLQPDLQLSGALDHSGDNASALDIPVEMPD